jgi:hypothetical protein
MFMSRCVAAPAKLVPAHKQTASKVTGQHRLKSPVSVAQQYTHSPIADDNVQLAVQVHIGEYYEAHGRQ